MNHLPVDLVYECLNFLDWKEYYRVCELFAIPFNFKRFFKDAPIILGSSDVINNEYEYLELIKYLYENGKDSDPDDDIKYACKHGHLETIKFLHSIGIKFCDDSMDSACFRNRLDIMKYLNSIGVEYTDDIMICACSAGHLEIVKYLHVDEGIKFTEEMVEDACIYDRVDIVKYIHDIGFKCNYLNDYHYHYDDHLDKWVKHSCIENLVGVAYDNSSIKVIEFLESLQK